MLCGDRVRCHLGRQSSTYHFKVRSMLRGAQSEEEYHKKVLNEKIGAMKQVSWVSLVHLLVSRMDRTMGMSEKVVRAVRKAGYRFT